MEVWGNINILLSQLIKEIKSTVVSRLLTSRLFLWIPFAFFKPLLPLSAFQPLIASCAGRKCPWRALALLPRLTPLVLTKIGISILNCCRRKRSFQWCPRVIGLMAPEICTKMLKKLSEKLRAKFPANTPGCSMLKFTRLDYAFLEVF